MVIHGAPHSTRQLEIEPDLKIKIPSIIPLGFQPFSGLAGIIKAVDLILDGLEVIIERGVAGGNSTAPIVVCTTPEAAGALYF